MRRLTRAEGRRIAIRAQLLDARRPPDLPTMVDRLTFLQLDPTDAVAPNADLVAWSRMGNGYEPAYLQQALERDRTLFEHRCQEVPTEPSVAMVRPMVNLGLYRADMAASSFGDARRREWLGANDAFRRRVLDLLGTSGPLPSRDIPDSAEVPWPLTGWTNNRNVTQMLEFLVARGEVAVAGRRGRQRLWNLAERVHPADLSVVPADAARKGPRREAAAVPGRCPPADRRRSGTPAEVDGTSGLWRVDPQATAEDFEGRTAMLSPFDRLIHDRVRAKDLFDFEFSLEMYKLNARRRWGYVALPVLDHARGSAVCTQTEQHDRPALYGAMRWELDTRLRNDDLPAAVR